MFPSLYPDYKFIETIPCDQVGNLLTLPHPNTNPAKKKRARIKVSS